MAAVGLVPGARLVVSTAPSVDGAVEVRVGETGEQHKTIQADLARHIYVVPDEEHGG
jgi:hypothetical protein